MTIHTIFMPETDGSGEAVELLTIPGDEVSEGDPLLVLESDKASMEVPSPVDGTVKRWLVKMGAEIATGTPLLELELLQTQANEDELRLEEPVVEAAKKTPAASESEQDAEIQEKSQVSAPLVRPPVIAVDAAVLSGAEIYAGPAVRKLARELGIDLLELSGSGKRGRILKEDLKAYAKQRLSADKPKPAVQGTGIPVIPLDDFTRYGEVEQQPLSGIAKATAAHMSRCWLNIPHVTLFDEVVIDDIEAFRRSIDHEAQGLPRRPTLLPFMIAIVARALRQFPQFNVALDPANDQLISKSYVNIGFAVDSPAGLVVPVIRDADKKSIRELTLDIADLSQRARDRKLGVADMQGGCFTISSMGAIGGTGFTPIINGPEVAILGIAKSAIKPVWDGDQFVPATMLPLCLSFDHRAINGGDAGRFMACVHAMLTDVRQALL
ncbi:2-oxo acid dehydrogenase subunit E2 [Pontibacterium sp.]|uniref:2-oxo acid dehydrogenase subunit E2 n=1 Tax=Pontibacterium sp. TaxID=2036026 RepID=UPI0035620249